MSTLHFGALGYFGPTRPPATLAFAPGLNVICGASDTGKSFVVDTIDYMLGQESPARDPIPESAGYDRIRVEIKAANWPSLVLERSIEGGDFRAYENIDLDGPFDTEAKILRWKHAGSRADTLSHALLERIGLTSKLLRRNADNATRGLSFRDLARLAVVNEIEIQWRQSPFLSGQYVNATPEYATLKLLLTGTDDSALVPSEDHAGRGQTQAGKLELIDQWIQDLRSELDEIGADEDESKNQVLLLNLSVNQENDVLSDMQRNLELIMARRATAARDVRDKRARIAEIKELTARFALLDTHYESDLRRLEAIRESGSLLSTTHTTACPLCGAPPESQHLQGDCDGNTDAIVEAAMAEIGKIDRLRRELAGTVATLEGEQASLEIALPGLEGEYRVADEQLSDVAAPVRTHRAAYNELVSKRAEIEVILGKFDRIHRLEDQREQIKNQDSSPATRGRTQITPSVLDEFSQTVQEILSEWHYPNANRVFFDEAKRDFQIAGKARGSSGKGLRAITHAAATIGLMVFCRDRGLPHPGFVVLDSPLLAYWEPEGAEDDLSGTDLKDQFYRYLLGLDRSSQVVIVENQHPPQFVFDEAHVTVFTKNPHQGRYGFFPR